MKTTVSIIASSLLAFSCRVDAREPYEVRDDLHFSIHARATNKDGSTPIYKDPTAAIESRVEDLFSRMTLEEKVAQL